MIPYSYIATLEIRHPQMLPATITDTLAIKPNTTFPRRHDYRTYWAHRFELFTAVSPGCETVEQQCARHGRRSAGGVFAVRRL